MEHKENDSVNKLSKKIEDMSPEELLEMKLKQQDTSIEQEELKGEPIKLDSILQKDTLIENSESSKLVSSELKIEAKEKPVDITTINDQPIKPSIPIIEEEPEMKIEPEKKIEPEPIIELKKEIPLVVEDKKQDMFKIPEPENLPKSQKEEELPFIKQPNELTDEYSFIIIPSWSRLVGYLDMGYYVNKNQKVHNITSDPVIFFARKSARVHTPEGYIYFIFGLGQIHLKFELQNGRYITDKREINTLVLQDFVYDFAASGKEIALGEDPSIIFNENIIKIPFDMSSKTPTQKTFISGIIMRNAFIPYKDIILEMMEVVRNQSVSNYNFGTMGLLMLTLTRHNYNELLVSDVTSTRKEYMTTTALISKIIPLADKIFDAIFTDDEKSIIKNGIIENYNRLGTIEYESSTFISIFEKLSEIYRLGSPFIDYTGGINPNNNMAKKLILESSRDVIGKFVSWPKESPRNSGWPSGAVEDKGKQKIVFNKDFMIEKAYQASSVGIETTEDLSSYKAVEVDEGEKFALRNAQNPTVKHKDLPPIPEIAENEKNLKKVIELLSLMKNIAEQDYEMCEVGKACELIREEIRKVVRQSDYIWELSKYENQFMRQPPGLGLSPKDKKRIIDKMNESILLVEAEVKVQEKKAQEERERLERERLAREKAEFERREQERKERERIEIEHREKVRAEQERVERERLERERIEREKDELHRKKLAEIKAQQDSERLAAEKKRQQEDMARLKKEQAEMKNKIKEDKKKQKEEQKRQKQLEKERKKLEKLEKQKKKLAGK